MGFHFGTFTKVAIAITSLAASNTASVAAAPGQNLRKLQTIDGTALGCWKDVKQDRILTKRVVLDTSNDAFSCARTCDFHELPLMGLQYGNECWCGEDTGDEYKRHGESEECDFPCPGTAGELCGGDLAMEMTKLNL